MFRTLQNATTDAHTVASTNPVPAPPCTVVIFGAVGDLTKRLLIPAIYNLAASHLLDDSLQIVRADHNVRTAETWRAELLSELQSFTNDASAEFHPDHIDEATWAWVAKRIDYSVFDFEHPGDYAKLKERLTKSLAGGNVIFYLAVSSRFFGTIVDELGAAGLLEESEGAFRRVVIEKPFGSDLPSARDLNARILKVAAERQIFRIDHFLGKEPVQGIMRCASATASSNRCGDANTSTPSRSRPWKQSASSIAVRSTSRPEHCATWCRIISSAC